MWIPIIFLFQTEHIQNEDLRIGTQDNLEIRGYRVDKIMSPIGDGTEFSVQVCDFDQQLDFIQLRWLQTSKFNDREIAKDVWSVDDIRVDYEPEEGKEACLLEDSFDDDQLK